MTGGPLTLAIDPSSNCTGYAVLGGIEPEELTNAFERERPEIVAAEAIDIANMAMMVWDRLTERPDAEDPDDWDARQEAPAP